MKRISSVLFGIIEMDGTKRVLKTWKLRKSIKKIEISSLPKIIICIFITDSQCVIIVRKNECVINLCEMKYANDTYTIDKEEDQRLRRRQTVFTRESKTKKAVHLTMITTYGLAKGGYSDDIHSQVTMEDLFKSALYR